MWYLHIFGLSLSLSLYLLIFRLNQKHFLFLFHHFFVGLVLWRLLYKLWPVYSDREPYQNLQTYFLLTRSSLPSFEKILKTISVWTIIVPCPMSMSNVLGSRIYYCTRVGDFLLLHIVYFFSLSYHPASKIRSTNKILKFWPTFRRRIFCVFALVKQLLLVKLLLEPKIKIKRKTNGRIQSRNNDDNNVIPFNAFDHMILENV